jgi:RNA polymerase sigma-70 factor (ECF subfamily)
MDDRGLLTDRFEESRAHLRAVAYRMLGSPSEADDAVQEAWLKLSRSDCSGVEDMRRWLTTVVGRVCLDMLRSRKSRREELQGMQLPVPAANGGDGAGPEHQALLEDSVGLALLVVLDTLTPAERVAFVLHDMFAVPFGEIARILGRSPDASRQLASRARRRVQGGACVPDADLTRQREAVGAFLTASREGDFDALLAVLHPDVVLRADRAAVPAGAPRRVSGASVVAGQALAFSGRARFAHPALVNGAAGIAVVPRGRLFAVLSFTTAGGQITAVDVIADPARLRQLDLVLTGG